MKKLILMKNNLPFGVSLLLISLLFIACSREEPLDMKAYAMEMNEWQKSRFNTLNASDGWLSLVGLEWLQPGENTLGKAADNAIVLPNQEAPDYAGILYWEGEKVWLRDMEGQEQLLFGPEMEPVIFNYGSLSAFIIKRDSLMGLRIRDSQSDVLRAFQGTDFYPVNPEWRKIATFVPYPEGKELQIQNIIGIVETQVCPGYLEFQHEGRTYSLDVILEEDQYFIIFGDATNGEETYGAGRYMYTSLPDQENKVILDFNKSYNPPCVFTDYATCPLPPPQNVFGIAIRAGELVYGEGH
jgi:uncharacterized protein (DUF1684 family)